jgi:tetratricopeptide (TPR) repeat protein
VQGGHGAPGGGDQRTVGGLLACLGAACLGDGIPARARDYYEESLEIRRSMGDRVRVSESLVGLGLCAVQLGELQKAEGLLRDAEQTLRGAGGGLQLARVHAAFAECAIAAGRTPEAARRLESAGKIRLEIGAMTGVPRLLDLWGCVAVEDGDYERAVRLFAAAAKGRERLACPARPSEIEFCERFVTRAESEVGEDRRGVLAEEGRGMPMRRALRYARGDG